MNPLHAHRVRPSPVASRVFSCTLSTYHHAIPTHVTLCHHPQQTQPCQHVEDEGKQDPSTRIRSDPSETETWEILKHLYAQRRLSLLKGNRPAIIFTLETVVKHKFHQQIHSLLWPGGGEFGTPAPIQLFLVPVWCKCWRLINLLCGCSDAITLPSRQCLTSQAF